MSDLDYLFNLKDREKTLKKRLVIAIIATIFSISSVVLIFIWYDWKLAVILFLAEYGMNIGNSLKFAKGDI